MPFDPKVIAAQLALNLIVSSDFPQIAADALEASLDGPAIRRLAALDSPSFFEVQPILTQAFEEMHLPKLEKTEAALFLSKRRARHILENNSDPLRYVGAFERLWIETDYAAEMQSFGTLSDEASVAREMGESLDSIRSNLRRTLKALAEE